MANEPVDLKSEGLRAGDLLHASLADTYVPLAVAAAITFHQAHGNTRAIVTRQDYDDALNIAAAALSRLITIYTVQDPRDERVAVEVNLSGQRFARGATRLVYDDGRIFDDLSVRRSDMLSATSLIKRTGLAFSFAFSLDPLHERHGEPRDGETREKAARNGEEA